MQKLEAGIHHFQANYFASNRQLFEQLAEAGQRPETLFITCSDSRVVPTLITNAAPGELFIVRNVGNIVPSASGGVLGGVSAAIEYAVEVLEVGNVIVCGHTNCGAIDAILHPERVSRLPFVTRWLAEAARIPRLIEEQYGNLDGEARVVAAVEENVLLQLENLRSFDFVARRLNTGLLKMSGWVFKIATGDVFDYDPVSGQFLRLAGDDLTRPALSSRPPPSRVILARSGASVRPKKRPMKKAMDVVDFSIYSLEEQTRSSPCSRNVYCRLLSDALSLLSVLPPAAELPNFRAHKRSTLLGRRHPRLLLRPLPRRRSQSHPRAWSSETTRLNSKRRFSSKRTRRPSRK